MSYQVITDVNWGQPPRVSGRQARPWTDNEDLYSAGDIIIDISNQLSLDEIDEIFLDSVRALFERMDEDRVLFERMDEDSLAIAQAKRLLIVWSERRRNLGNMIESLSKASQHLRSVAAVLADSSAS